ncbi:unnamed protein product [Arabidopsis lyrata]|nr:unnamed protein product [Arabidopsis lyrata]
MHPFRIFSSIVLSNSPLFFSIPLNDASGSELLFTIPIPSSYLQNSPLRWHNPGKLAFGSLTKANVLCLRL